MQFRYGIFMICTPKCVDRILATHKILITLHKLHFNTGDGFCQIILILSPFLGSNCPINTKFEKLSQVELFISLQYIIFFKIMLNFIKYFNIHMKLFYFFF